MPTLLVFMDWKHPKKCSSEHMYWFKQYNSSHTYQNVVTQFLAGNFLLQNWNLQCRIHILSKHHISMPIRNRDNDEFCLLSKGRMYSVSYHKVVCHSVSYHKVVCHSVSYHKVVCHSVSYHKVVCHSVSYHKVVCHSVSYHKVVCHSVSYHKVVCHSVSYHKVVCHSVSYQMVVCHCMTSP